jgi:hypothetical protein
MLQFRFLALFRHAEAVVACLLLGEEWKSLPTFKRTAPIRCRCLGQRLLLSPSPHCCLIREGRRPRLPT